MARRKKSTHEKIQEGLLQLACGEISDAVSLLYLSDEEAMARLPTLNLFNVSEIKRPKGGGLEIKFFDRIKALEQLAAADSAPRSEELGFYQALEKSTENARSDNPHYD